jgi:predicted naringenin-chalcone synthase
MRFINELYTAPVGFRWSNTQLLPQFEESVSQLPLESEARQQLRDFVRYQMLGDRARRTVIPNWTPTALSDFGSRARAYEAGADEAVELLARQILPDLEASGARLDAIITTTSTGNLMPGISYRMARRLGAFVRNDSMLVDLGNVGCTGSSKALNLARSLDESFKNILVVSVELPTTLIDLTGTDYDLWQGNCTFGDGAAAVLISNNVELGSLALAIKEIWYKHFADTGLDLIKWRYRNYYSFALADQNSFEEDVRSHVATALRETQDRWCDVPKWAIHPAGITLLMRISRELRIPKEAMQGAAAHYHDHSNMSSASLLFLLKELASATPAGSAINLLTMGAGFNVIYGQVERVR